MNVVSSSTVERLKLPVEPHPQSYKVAWIDNTSILVTHRCLVSFSFGVYSDTILCDIIPMKITHIILGQLWLFDQNVKHNGRENTSALMVGMKAVVLEPMTLDEVNKFKGLKPKVIEGKDIEPKISVVATNNYGPAYRSASNSSRFIQGLH